MQPSIAYTGVDCRERTSGCPDRVFVPGANQAPRDLTRFEVALATEREPDEKLTIHFTDDVPEALKLLERFSAGRSFTVEVGDPAVLVQL
jgi:hypothetical protein